MPLTITRDPAAEKTSASAEDEVRWPINLTRQYPAAVRGSSVSVFVCSRAKSFSNTKKTQHTQKPQRQKHNKCLTKNSKTVKEKMPRKVWPWKGSSHKLQQ